MNPEKSRFYAVAVVASLVVVVANASIAHGQAAIGPWQVGLELAPVAYDVQLVDRELVSGLQDPGADVIPTGNSSEDQLTAFPAQLGALVGYQPWSRLSFGVRLGFFHESREAGDRQATSAQLGPFARVIVLDARNFRAAFELNVSYQLVRDGYSGYAAKWSAWAMERGDPLNPSTPTAVGHGPAALLQFGLQWFVSEDVSLDPALRAEALYHASTLELPDGPEVDFSITTYRVSLVVGVSIWLGDDVIHSSQRGPAQDTRTLFKPAED